MPFEYESEQSSSKLVVGVVVAAAAVGLAVLAYLFVKAPAAEPQPETVAEEHAANPAKRQCDEAWDYFKAHASEYPSKLEYKKVPWNHVLDGRTIVVMTGLDEMGQENPNYFDASLTGALNPRSPDCQVPMPDEVRTAVVVAWSTVDPKTYHSVDDPNFTKKFFRARAVVNVVDLRNQTVSKLKEFVAKPPKPEEHGWSAQIDEVVGYPQVYSDVAAYVRTLAPPTATAP